MLKQTSRVLIVEDDYFIATELLEGFQAAGVGVVGPVSSIAEALKMFEEEKVDAAVLDINLDGEKVCALADALIGHGLPVVFVTGYERTSLPDRYRDVPLCLKPFDSAEVVRALGRAG